jgi:putative CocE/NonD family hydrolase
MDDSVHHEQERTKGCRRDLVVSTSGTDSDFVVKLIDVSPDGYQMLVRGEPFRAKYRNSFSKPEPMKPDQPTNIDYEMPDINHSFMKGHRIMVQVQSTWFPLMDRNPQKFVNIYAATESDFQKATERVYHSSALRSQLKIRRLAK